MTDGAHEWEPRRELVESVALLGLLLASVGATVGSTLGVVTLAVRVLAG